MPSIQLKYNLILASSSVIRKKVLESVGLSFKQISPDIDEKEFKENNAHLSPRALSLELACEKGQEVSRNNSSDLVLAADQVCELEDHIFNKPENEKEAFKQLKKLNGLKHKQHSGVSLYHGTKCLWKEVFTAELSMHYLDDGEIKSYISLDNPIFCAGAYKYESFGKHLFKDVVGDADVILGLPVVPFLSALRRKGYIKLTNN